MFWKSEKRHVRSTPEARAQKKEEAFRRRFQAVKNSAMYWL